MEVTIELNKPHEGQAAVLESNARFKVLMCGRRWGKSLISKNISITEALNGRITGYVTPTYALAKVFFDDISKIIPSGIATANKSDLTFKFITGGEIRFFTGERLDNFRGLRLHNVIIDEAAYIPHLKDAWNNAIRPTLTDFQGKAIFISTPRGKDFFYGANNKSSGYKMFATELVNLGSVFDCDWQGIPKVQPLLIPSTYKTPPDTFEPTDDNKIETSGMVGEGGNTRGLFFEVNCVGVHSDFQQVLNMRHICEMGVDLDELRYISSFGSNTLTPQYPDFIIGINDIDERIQETRSINQLKRRIDLIRK